MSAQGVTVTRQTVKLAGGCFVCSWDEQPVTVNVIRLSTGHNQSNEFRLCDAHMDELQAQSPRAGRR